MSTSHRFPCSLVLYHNLAYWSSICSHYWRNYFIHGLVSSTREVCITGLILCNPCFQVFFRLIGIQSSLYQLYITTSFRGRHNCCYCQIWSICFRIRLLTCYIRLTLPKHFSVRIMTAPQVTKFFPFLFPFVSLQSLNVNGLLVCVLSSR
jgi:hypothetical protein